MSQPTPKRVGLKVFGAVGMYRAGGTYLFFFTTLQMLALEQGAKK